MKKIVSKVVLALAFFFVFVFAGKTVLAQGTNLVPTEAKSVSNKVEMLLLLQAHITMLHLTNSLRVEILTIEAMFQ